MTLDGNILFPDAVDLQSAASSPEAKAVPPEGETVDGEFVKLADKEVCQENGKPIIYFFGSEGCSHCRWEKPILEKVVASFKDKISYHENIDTAKDQDVFSQYSTGAVPTIVLGCQYYRIGSGENLGEQKETEILTKLIQELL
jgi:thiol-disulfide isomerase/thioredoxin